MNTQLRNSPKHNLDIIAQCKTTLLKYLKITFKVLFKYLIMVIN
ncbi:hypothetical protein ALT717_370007 [Alteromonas macleodii]